MARIILADEDPQVLQALKARLEHAGHDVDYASEPNTVVALAWSGNYDLLVMDLGTTPGANELVVKDARHQEKLRIPIIIFDSHPVKLEFERLGVQHVQKPDSRLLLSVIDSTLKSAA